MSTTLARQQLAQKATCGPASEWTPGSQSETLGAHCEGHMVLFGTRACPQSKAKRLAFGLKSEDLCCERGCIITSHTERGSR